jgi:diguanylate cyclase (GGDEF)-like protein/PAS domain S-box-containing protein
MIEAQIILVEDERIVALDIEKMLQRVGYSVVGSADCGEKALELVAKIQPDLVLMDIKLKGELNGIETAKLINSRFNTPIIFLTAFADDATIERAREAEPSGYMVKPVNERDLLINIEIALHKHRLQMELKEREEYFRSLIDNASDLIFVIDNEMNISYGSPSIERVLGHKPEDYIGRNVKHFIHADEQSNLFEILNSALENPGKTYSYEHRLFNNRGEWYTFLSTGKCVIEKSERYLIINSLDISSRIEMEEALRESEEKHRILFETMAQGVVYQDANGEITAVNPAAECILGITLDQMQGRTSIDHRWRAIHEDGSDFPGEEHPSMVALKTGNPVNDVIMGICNPLDKDRRWIIINATPLFVAGDEKPRQVYTTFSNITRLRKAEFELERRLEIEKIISEISSLFVGVDDFNQSIDTALSLIGIICEASRASLFYLAEDKTTMQKSHEWSAPGVLSGLEETASLPIGAYKWFRENLTDGTPYHIEDISSLPDEAMTERELLQRTQVKSFLLIPILINNETKGVLSLTDITQPRKWDDEDVAMLRVIAEIIGYAIERKQAEEAKQKAHTQSEILRQAVTALTLDLDLNNVLEQILIYLEKLLPYQNAAILLIDSKTLNISIVRGSKGEEFPHDASDISENQLFRKIIESDDPIVLDDVRDDPRLREMTHGTSVRGWMGVPMQARGYTIGLIILHSHVINEYSKEDIALAKSYAAEAAIAIENAQLFKQIQELSITDPLTNLYNRRYFFSLLRVEFERSRRYDHPLSVAMLDIDHYKQVNDTYGHFTGDHVLEDIAQRLKKNLREIDIIARYGGDEFVIILPDTQLNDAIQVTERLKDKLAASPIYINGTSIIVSASVGLAEIDKDCVGLDTLLNRADQALYAAKQSGRNQVLVWEKDLENSQSRLK